MTNDIWSSRIAGPNSPLNMQVGYLIMRLMLGLNLFMHGIIRHINGIEVWLDPMAETFVGTILPMPLVIASLYVIPTAEVILGFLLMVGLFTRSALLASVALFLVLHFGHGVRQIWSNMHLVMHYSIYFWIMFVLIRYNWLALDNKMFGNKLSE